jgi:hypothetical protein
MRSSGPASRVHHFHHQGRDSTYQTGKAVQINRATSLSATVAEFRGAWKSVEMLLLWSRKLPAEGGAIPPRDAVLLRCGCCLGLWFRLVKMATGRCLNGNQN